MGLREKIIIEKEDANYKKNVEEGLPEEEARASVKKLTLDDILKHDLYTRARQYADGTYTSTRGKEIADAVVTR